MDKLIREVSESMVREILVALCERDGLSLESDVEPGEPARNYELALRLRIGHVFGLKSQRVVMTSVVVYRHPEKPLDLVLNPEDIADVRSPRDVMEVSCEEAGCAGCNALHRVMGTAHLNLTFFPGKCAVWRER